MLGGYTRHERQSTNLPFADHKHRGVVLCGMDSSPRLTVGRASLAKPGAAVRADIRPEGSRGLYGSWCDQHCGQSEDIGRVVWSILGDSQSDGDSASRRREEDTMNSPPNECAAGECEIPPLSHAGRARPALPEHRRYSAIL